MIRSIKLVALVAASALALIAGSAQAQVQGVTKDEITLGTIQDLSGPIALYGKFIRAGLQMRVDEANEKGGVNGRKIKLLVEDSGYDPKRGVLAAQKLIEQDKIFAMVGTLGTGVVAASMPIVLDKGLPHLFPVTAADITHTPLHPMKFASFMPYDDGIGSGVRYLVPKNGYKKVGILHQDDDFGLDVLRGTQAALKELKMELAETTSYKRGATDFSSQIAKLKAADVELIVLGSTLRETIGAMGEARKLGWNVAFLSSQAAYTALVPQLGKGVVEGLYAMTQVPHPYAEGANPQLAAWIESYKKRFNSDPDVMSSYGYKTMDMVLKGIEAAGKEPTPQSLSAALEGMKQPADFLGNGSVEFSKTNHLGRAQGRVAQIQNGKWVNQTDFLK